MKPWYERWPDLLEKEENLLRASGMKVDRDDTAFKRGVARLIVDPKRDDLPSPLIVTFPDSFPFFRFEIQAPSLELGRHQNPYAKNLCVMGRSSSLWTRGSAEDNTVVAMISNAVPKVLAANDSELDEEKKPEEEPQGEPASDYFPYDLGAVLVDSSWQIPSYIQHGFVEIGVRNFKPPPEPLFMQAAILNLSDSSGNKLCTAELGVQRNFSSNRIQACWVRADPLAFNGAQPLYAGLSKLIPKEATNQFIKKQSLNAIAAIFSEESSVAQMSDAWVIGFEFKVVKTRPNYKTRKKKR